MVPVQSFMQWFMAVLLIALILSAMNRYCLPSSYRPHVQWAIVVGGLVSTVLFPFYMHYRVDTGHWLLGGVFIGGLGVTMVSSTSLADKFRILPRQLARWFGRQSEHFPRPDRENREESEPSLPKEPSSGIPPTHTTDSLELLEGLLDQLPDGQVPVEVRMELSWLYLEQGRFETAMQQARLALAENALLGRAETGRLRRWLRYLHCYQAIQKEGAYHVHKERTSAQVRQRAWERYQQREEFWRESV